MSMGLVMKLAAQEKPADRTDEQQQAFIEAEVAEATKKRVDELAHKLLIRIEPIIHGVDIQEVVKEDVAKRLEAPGGGAILVTVGYAYQSESSKKLKSFLGLGGLAARIRENGHKVSQTYKLAKSLVALNSAASKLETDEEIAAREARIAAGHHETEEEVARRAELEDRMARHGISVIWKLGLIEVEDITRQACHKILNDYSHDVSHDLRQKRASAIGKLGALYQKLAKKYVKDAAGVLADLGVLNPDLSQSGSSDTSSSSGATSPHRTTSPGPTPASSTAGPLSPRATSHGAYTAPPASDASAAPPLPPRDAQAPPQVPPRTAPADSTIGADADKPSEPIVLGPPPA